MTHFKLKYLKTHLNRVLGHRLKSGYPTFSGNPTQTEPDQNRVQMYIIQLYNIIELYFVLFDG